MVVRDCAFGLTQRYLRCSGGGSPSMGSPGGASPGGSSELRRMSEVTARNLQTAAVAGIAERASRLREMLEDSAAPAPLVSLHRHRNQISSFRLMRRWFADSLK